MVGWFIGIFCVGGLNPAICGVVMNLDIGSVGVMLFGCIGFILGLYLGFFGGIGDGNDMGEDIGGVGGRLGIGGKFPKLLSMRLKRKIKKFKSGKNGLKVRLLFLMGLIPNPPKVSIDGRELNIGLTFILSKLNSLLN